MAIDTRKVLVLGLARSGTAVAALLAEHGHNVLAFDESHDAVSRFGSNPRVQSKANVSVVDAAEAETVIRDCDELVISPGVPLDHPLVLTARQSGIPVVGEVEAASRYTRARIIGVTGTNGKSTTVGVIGDIVSSVHSRTVVAGNVGTPFAEVVQDEQDVIVLELSSFQLDTIDAFRCDIAVLLNVTPDHLDRYHNSMKEYAESKARILNRADSDSVFVYNAEDSITVEIADGFPGQLVPFSTRRELSQGVFLDGDRVISNWKGSAETVIERPEFTPTGLHNAENLLAAIGASMALGITTKDMVAPLRAYRPLPHRMELVRVVDGVSYINDSKATNVDAACKSLESVDGQSVIILGGRDKDGDFSALLPFVGRVRVAILIGEAQGVIRAALEGACVLLNCKDLPDAVRAAAGLVEAGDTVLLAPACASFDMFPNYEARGVTFRDAVNAL